MRHGMPLVSPTHRHIPTGMESALKHDLGRRLVQIRPRSSGSSGLATPHSFSKHFYFGGARGKHHLFAINTPVAAGATSGSSVTRLVVALYRPDCKVQARLRVQAMPGIQIVFDN